MSMPEVVDVHVHLTRDTAQQRLVFPKPGYPDEWYGANEDRLDAWMDSEGLSRLFMINYMDTHRILERRISGLEGADATAREAAREELKPLMVERLREFNHWACDLGRRNPRVIPFVCVDIGLFYEPQLMMDELEARIAEGARGVKLHPGLSRFMPDDERMFPLYERLQDAEIPILSDSGAIGGRGPDGEAFGAPLHFAPVFERFPRLRFIMAHLASAYWDERLEIARRFPHVHFDISGGFYAPGHGARDGHRAVPVEDAARFLHKIGIERVMFGSDSPADDALREQLRTVMRLALTDGEKERVLSKNAREFIGLP